ncbi:hypothetical protein BSIN_0483 [Burkholderia singularis]|uniref:Uncharacterized protein n=1 Tax=Burkholderia singularis TaxID=1503053 RepID=A0A238H6Z7_9BURK|nr:hypothetical protein BSIN_0483 [Burkholderia singularis]
MSIIALCISAAGAARIRCVRMHRMRAAWFRRVVPPRLPRGLHERGAR